MEVTKWLKPSDSVSRIGDSASVQAATRVNVEQASKRTMCRLTRRPLRGRLICLSEMTVVTSNLPSDEWTEEFGSERLTGALLDRLTHHIHILEMNGESYRLNQSRKQQDSPAD